MRSPDVLERIRRKQEITQTGRPMNQKGIAEEKKEEVRNLQNAPGSEAKIDKARRENRFDEGIERL